MAIRLEKGQRINLKKESGTKLTNFCVGCNWGAIIKRLSLVFQPLLWMLTWTLAA